jgi:oligosaccharide repeat unit polymerase
MKPIIESTLWVALLALLLAVNSVWPIPLSAGVILAAAILVGLLFASWWNFDGGRHPCFLFLGMLFVFQGSRLAGSLLGVTRDPMRIVVATAVPLDVTNASARITLFLIVASALCIYIPCRLSHRPVALPPGELSEWLPALCFVVLITFPFALYKNLMYFLYIRAHGGYLVVYTDNAAVLHSAGPVARSVSIICAAAILIAYVIERRRGRVAFLLTLYFGLSGLDLLIGFRGKVFTEILSIWLLHNLKTGKRFRLVHVAVAALLINSIAIAIAAYREDSSIKMLSPFAFLASQGVSMNVTEAAVQYRDRFARHGLSYVIDGFTSGISPSASSGEGRLWTTDLTAYLNPIASRMGFGTASTYLAELYLLAGIPAVILGSLAVGYSLKILHRISSSAPGAIAMAFVLPSLIYLPRAEFLNPLAAFVKAIAACAIVVAFAWCFRSLLDLLRPGSASAAGAGTAIRLPPE